MWKKQEDGVFASYTSNVRGLGHFESYFDAIWGKGTVMRLICHAEQLDLLIRWSFVR